MADSGGSEVPEFRLERWARKTIAFANTIGWSGVAAIVAVLALILTLMQQESFRLDKRAWVTSSGFHIQQSGLETSFVGIYKNSGETPAIDVSVTRGCEYERPTSRNFDEFDANQQEARVAQSASVSVLPPGGKNQSIKKCPRFQKGRKDVLYVYGVITYWDVFDRKHRTDYCNRYTPDMTKLLTACSDFNRLVY